MPSPTPGPAKDLPGGHHHHHHHHHATARAAPPNAKVAPPPRSPSPVILPKPKQTVLSKAVLDSVADRPRTHLGDVVYEPILKRARLQDARTGRPPRSGFKSTPKPLPWDLIEGKENCTLMMKIGKEHLDRASREEITCRRALWGTDVYTDDSDVVAACIHAGWIRGEWPADVDVSMLGLDEGYVVSDVRSLLKGRANGAKEGNPPTSQPGSGALTVLTEPPKNGPMPVPENRDLHVTLLILPRLEKYASTTRFGIKSREFGGPVGDEEAHQRAIHDGISFMVTELRWVTNGGASQNRLRGKARRERIRKALAEVETMPAWISRPVNGDADRNGHSGADKEGDPGLGWWKRTASKPPSEGDKENQNTAGGEVKQQTQAAEATLADQEGEVQATAEPRNEAVQAHAEDGTTAADKETVEAPAEKEPEQVSVEKTLQPAPAGKTPETAATEDAAATGQDAEAAPPEKVAEAEKVDEE